MEILIVCLMWKAGKDEDTQKKNPKWLEWLHKRGWYFFLREREILKRKGRHFAEKGKLNNAFGYGFVEFEMCIKYLREDAQEKN